MDLFMKKSWTRLALAMVVFSTWVCGRQEVDIATLASNSDQVIWEAGQKALKGKQWDVARQHFRRIVDGFPQSPLVPQARLAAVQLHSIAPPFESLTEMAQAISYPPQKTFVNKTIIFKYGGGIS